MEKKGFSRAGVRSFNAITWRRPFVTESADALRQIRDQGLGR